MRNLKSLDLWGIFQTQDFRPLHNLTNLQFLSFAGGTPNEFSFFTRLPNLIYLSIIEAGIDTSDLIVIARLTNLTKLDLRFNKITDVSPLAKLTNLTELLIRENPIQDTSPLASLTKLVVVDVEITAPPTTPVEVKPTPEPPRETGLIRDPNLAAAVREALGLASNVAITEQVMQRLTTLDASNRQIEDLTGLEHATQLEVLTLSDNQISDVKPLAGLTQLERLALENNQIRYISSLAGLTRLTHLFLKNNKIRNVTALAGLVNLRQLILDGNPIEDTSPLVSLTNLDVVDIEITGPTQPPRPIDPTPDPPRGTNLIPDANLAAAVREALGLGPNATITEQQLKRLTRLQAENGEIKDLTGLEYATQLVELYLAKNKISDIEPLAGLVKLDVLALPDNQISDVTPLTRLTKLTKLYLGGNQIRDVSTLARLTKLIVLTLDYNQIQEVNSLVGLAELVELYLNNNQIRDVTPLSGLINLKNLYLAGNPITDTSPLTRLPKLRGIDIEISVVVRVESGDYPPMYWVNTNSATLHRLVDTEVENLVPNVRNATSMAIDVENEKLYWTEQTGETTGRIRLANLNGTNVRLVKELTSVPHDLALDAAGGKIYLTNAWGKVQRLDVNGSNFQPNLIIDLDTPRGLVLDVSGGKVYWTEKPGQIRRANLDGSNIEDVLTGLENPINVAIFGDTVYWTEKTSEDSGEIQSTNLNGPLNVTIHYSFPQGFPVDIAVDPVEDKLYWTTSRGNIG